MLLSFFSSCLEDFFVEGFFAEDLFVCASTCPARQIAQIINVTIPDHLIPYLLISTAPIDAVAILTEINSGEHFHS
jgi:hypothetical protein